MTDNSATSHPRDRRHFSRVDFRHQITLSDPRGNLYPGAFNDISLKGMLFWAEELPPAGLQVTGMLELGEASIQLTGEVLRASPERGAAIHFLGMDVESFSHLRRLVTLNMGDAERIDQEFFDSL